MRKPTTAQKLASYAHRLLRVIGEMSDRIQALEWKNANFVWGGVALISEERMRQRREWTDQHDDAHANNEIIQAAQCYVWAARQLSIPLASEQMPLDLPVVFSSWSNASDRARTSANDIGSRDWRVPQWPWTYDTWKPGDDPVRCLVKAGALIAAEIDRLQRARR